MPDRPGAAYRAYAALTALAAPAIHAHVARKQARADVPQDRLPERRGHATKPRPEGPLVWFHAASVGESLSLLDLLDRMLARRPALHALVTSGTATSARLLATRLPDRALHQFAPLDTPGPVGRFLDHWHPDLGIFVESELWPRQLAEAKRRGIPLALVNARLSQKSLRAWRRLGATARHVFGRFDLILTQDDATRARIAELADTEIRTGGNLKAAAPAPPADPDQVETWKERLAGRPAWVASSTHEGEDAPLLEAHREVLETFPGALCILAPRHPDRGPAIADLAAAMGLTTALRSANQPLAPKTQVYIADTMGEMGLWYRAAPLVFLAGSLGRAGGHNPWEPIAAGAALLFGPNVANATGDYAALFEAGAARRVEDRHELARALVGYLGHPEKQQALRDAAASVTAAVDVDAFATDLLALMDRRP